MKNKKNRNLLCAVATAGLFLSPAMGAEQKEHSMDGYKYHGMSTSASHESKKAHQNRMESSAVFEGSIDRIERTTLSAFGQTSRDHTFFKVHSQNGKSVIIGFETEKDFDSIDLETGENIRITGDSVEFGGDTVIIAQSIERESGERIEVSEARVDERTRSARERMKRSSDTMDEDGEAGEGLLSERQQDLPPGNAFQTDRSDNNTRTWMSANTRGTEKEKAERASNKDKSKHKSEMDKRALADADSKQRVDYNELRDELAPLDNAVFLTGTIEDIHQVRLVNVESKQSEAHLLVKLELESGETTILGIATEGEAFTQVSLKTGKRIMIRGRESKIDGTGVVIVEDIELKQTALKE